MTVQFEPGQRVRLPHGPDSWVTIDFAQQGSAGDWVLYVARDGENSFKKVILTAEDASEVEVLAQGLRSALRKYALLPADKRSEPGPETAKAVRWLESACLSVDDLKEAKVVRPALDALTVNLDGTAAGANTVSRKRAVLHHFLEYAVELGDLDANPLHTIKWTPPKTSQTVDPASSSTRYRHTTSWSQ
jgi:hypothetical protein